MKKIKYALIGFGGIAEKRIAREGFSLPGTDLPSLPNAELIGVTDINPARKQVAEAQNLKWYESVEEIFDSKDIEAVFIATNNSTHLEIAQQALLAGKHVIVEKPMAVTSASALKLQKLAESLNLSLSVDHMMTKNQLNIKAAELIQNGAIGNVSEACFHMEFLYGNTPQEANGWRCSSQSELGGPIGDIASHCFYMAEYLFDSRITTVKCVYYPKTLSIAVEDGALIVCMLENGINCNINVSFSSPRTGPGIFFAHGYEIYGENAILRGIGTLCQLSGFSNDPINIRLEVENDKKLKLITPDSPQNIYQGVIAEHAESILNNKPFSAVDGVRNILLCEAAHESAKQNGKKINIIKEI